MLYPHRRRADYSTRVRFRTLQLLYLPNIDCEWAVRKQTISSLRSSALRKRSRKPSRRRARPATSRYTVAMDYGRVVCDISVRKKCPLILSVVLTILSYITYGNRVSRFYITLINIISLSGVQRDVRRAGLSVPCSQQGIFITLPTLNVFNGSPYVADVSSQPFHNVPHCILP